MDSVKLDSVLVTGGMGFIGSHLVDRCMEAGARVTVLDNLSNGSPSNIKSWRHSSRLRTIIGDVRNPDDVREALRDVTTVFHEAARVSVSASVREPIPTLETNVQGTAVLLDECRRKDVSKIVVASSSSVYGDTPTLPKSEDMRENPISPYAVSKLTQEKLALAFVRTYGMDCTVLRYFNVYGPRQRRGPYAGVISVFIENALNAAPIPIEGDGLQTRDFTYVDDIVDCNILASTTPKTKGEVYNVGGGARISIVELADHILALTRSTSTKVYKPPRKGDVRHSLADIRKAYTHFGYKPRTEIVEGLKKTIQWYRENTTGF